MMKVGHTLLALALATPLLLILVAPFVRRPLRLLPWAAMPGLAAAVLAPSGVAIEISFLLLQLHLALDRIGAVFLGFGSLLWLLSGAYACRYLAQSDRTSSFTIFWLLTLAGTFGAFVAADVVTFYAAFSVMSLATYGLVIHDCTASARRAGLIYIVLAVLGETSLAAALMLAASHSHSLLFSDVSAALVASQWANYVLAGLLVGFGIKAGLVPLHVWLPLAHPEAPTPASAVLSGVIVTAGIVGLIRLLPADGLSPVWSDTLIMVGLVTAYYGVGAGLMQTDAKAILAYSTLSQMGIVVTVLASGLGAAASARTLDVVALYASHHGLAKGALFLVTGVVAACGVQAFRLVMAVTAFMALAIAGFPLSGGALAKLAIKNVLGDGPTALLVTMSAIGTTLLMLRFLYVLAQKGGASPTAPASGLIVPWAGVVIAAVAVPWMMFSHLSGHPGVYAIYPANIWSVLWPILLALVPAFIAVRRWPAGRLTVPQGDIVVIAESLGRRIGEGIMQASIRLPVPRAPLIAVPLGPIDAAEEALRRWSVSGPTLVLIAVLIAVLLSN